MSQRIKRSSALHVPTPAEGQGAASVAAYSWGCSEKLACFLYKAVEESLLLKEARLVVVVYGAELNGNFQERAF